MESFRDTHRVEVVSAGGRDPSVFPFLSRLGDAERWEAVRENRTRPMNRLFCESEAHWPP